MAHNYSASISVKDYNSIATLQKIIKSTEDLKKHLKEIAKDKVTIEAKEGASFHNVENQINKLVTKPKTIKINATENVTRTMSNVQRQMFEMTGKLDSKITTSFKAVGTNMGNSLINSLNRSLPGISSRLARTVEANKVASVISGKASELGYSGAIPVAGGALGGSFMGGILSKGKNKSAFDSVLGNANKIEGGANTWMQKLRNSVNKVAHKIPSIMGPIADALELSSPFMKKGDTRYDGESWFAGMIEKQKKNISKLNAQYKELTGKDRKEYLPQYKLGTAQIGPDEDIGTVTRTGSSAIGSIIASASRAGSAIKTSLGNAFSWVKGKAALIPSAIGTVANAITTKFPVAWNRVQTMGTKAFYAIQRGAYTALYSITRPIGLIGNSLIGIKSKASNVFNAVKSIAKNAFSMLPQPLQNGMSKAFSKVKSLASSAASHMKSVFSKAASSISSVLKSGLTKAFSCIKGLVAGAVAGITAGFVTGTKHLAEQESNQVSMKHFIKNGDRDTNGGTNTMDASQITKASDKFMNSLTYLADSTPFENDDIYSAGRRAIQMTNGDTKAATNLTRQAADMAALNPGTSAADAMEALFDLKNGETERMKTFGMKITQDDLKQLVRGTTGGDSLTTDETNKAFTKLTQKGGQVENTFGGGASELSGTMGGRFSTLKGQAKQVLTEAVKPFEGMLKGAIENGIKYLGVSLDQETGELNFDGISGKLIDSMSKVASFIKDLFNGDSSNFPIIDNIINAFNTLSTAVSPVGEILSQQFDNISSSCQDSFGGMGGIIEGAAGVIGNVITGLSPILELLSPCFDFIKTTAEAVWPIVSDLISGASTVIQDAVGFIIPIIKAATQIMGNIGDIVAAVWPNISDTISKCWDNLKPVFELFDTLAQAVADVFSFCWPGIADIINTLWDAVGGALESFTKGLGEIAEAAKWAYDKLCEFGKWMDDKWDNYKEESAQIDSFANSTEESNDVDTNIGEGTGFRSDSDGGFAFGLSRVPRDGFKATLHQGERVLTAAENREYSSSQVTNNNRQPVVVNVYESNNTEKTVKAVYEALTKANA